MIVDIYINVLTRIESTRIEGKLESILCPHDLFPFITGDIHTCSDRKVKVVESRELESNLCPHDLFPFLTGDIHAHAERKVNVFKSKKSLNLFYILSIYTPSLLEIYILVLNAK
jgi:hypothetical protein